MRHLSKTLEHWRQCGSDAQSFEADAGMERGSSGHVYRDVAVVVKLIRSLCMRSLCLY